MTANKSEILNFIQLALEKFKDEEVSILFMTSDKNRGVISGDYGNLAVLLAFNMVAYPQLKCIVDTAVKTYNTHYDVIKEAVENGSPSHEVIDNYGIDVNSILSEVIKPQKD